MAIDLQQTLKMLWFPTPRRLVSVPKQAIASPAGDPNCVQLGRQPQMEIDPNF
jgi:hypothetical protein